MNDDNCIICKKYKDNYFHAHVIARYKNAPKEYWGPKVDEWPDAPRGTVYDVWKLDEKIIKEIKNK